MIILSYIIVSLLLVVATLSLIFLVGRTRRKTFAKAKAEQLRAANRPFEVWICRHCGFMILMRNEDCAWCGTPRPGDFISRTIPGKDFTAQLQKPLPKPYSEGSEKTV